MRLTCKTFEIARVDGLLLFIIIHDLFERKFKEFSKSIKKVLAYHEMDCKPLLKTQRSTFQMRWMQGTWNCNQFATDTVIPWFPNTVRIPWFPPRIASSSIQRPGLLYAVLMALPRSLSKPSLTESEPPQTSEPFF